MHYLLTLLNYVLLRYILLYLHAGILKLRVCNCTTYYTIELVTIILTYCYTAGAVVQLRCFSTLLNCIRSHWYTSMLRVQLYDGTSYLFIYRHYRTIYTTALLIYTIKLHIIELIYEYTAGAVVQWHYYYYLYTLLNYILLDLHTITYQVRLYNCINYPHY